MTKRLSLLLIVCFFIHSNGLGAADDPPDSTKSQKKEDKSVSITMFIPGLYQLKSRKYIKGTLLLGAFAGCITGTIVHNNNGNHWYEKYRNSTNVEEIVLFRKNTENSFKKRNLFIAGIFAVGLAHIIDVTFFKTKKGGVKGEAGNNSVRLGIYYSF